MGIVSGGVKKPNVNDVEGRIITILNYIQRVYIDIGYNVFGFYCVFKTSKIFYVIWVYGPKSELKYLLTLSTL